MLKKVLSVCSIFLFVASTLLAVLVATNFPGCVSGAVLYVGGVGPGNYSSIQSAIDSAFIGDTVYVFSGTYVEKVTISKAITLKGEDKNTTIIDGSGTGNAVRIQSTDYVEVRSLTLKNTNRGVSVYYSNNVKIEEINILSSISDAILIEFSNDVEVTDCELSGMGVASGVGVDNSNNLVIKENYIQRYVNGIYCYKSSNPFIHLNTINSNANGISILEGSGSNIEGNTLWNNSGSGLKVDKSNFIMKSTKIKKSGFGVQVSLLNPASIYNSTVSQSSNYDFHVGKNTLTLVNVSFDYESVNVSDSSSIIIVKNYLDVYVINSNGDPVSNADVIVTNNDQEIYDSIEDDAKTDLKGLVRLIQAVYIMYQYDSVLDYKIIEGTTSIEAFFGPYVLEYLGEYPQEIDMSTSHRETFQLDTKSPTISGVTSKGNNSVLLNTFDRSMDDSIAIMFKASEPGSYEIIVNTSGDHQFNEANDTVLFGSATGEMQTVYWDGTDEGATFPDGVYFIQISLTDLYDNVIQTPYNELIVKIVNTDSDGDGVPDYDDDFPEDPTQWSDNDGDGYGDNPNGTNYDAFPTNPTQWKDSDGDGYGDNPLGTNADAFPNEKTQWLDSDSDGYGDNQSGKKGDAFPLDPTQWKDSDGDGFGDNASGNNPDAFPSNKNEWSDRDGDGYGDRSDEFPDDPKEWKDSDGDGVGDNSDLFPGFNELILFFIIGIIVVILVVVVVMVRKKKVAARPFETQTTALVAPPAARPPPPVARKLPPPPKRMAPKKAPQKEEQEKTKKAPPPKPQEAKPKKDRKEPPPPPPEPSEEEQA